MPEPPTRHPLTSIEILHRIVAACKKNAAALLSAAELCHANRQASGIAYHLAILSLEEIGKSEIMRVLQVAEEHSRDASSYEKHTTDHVKKLFWAMWGPTWGDENRTPEQFSEMRGLAARLHAKRMEALYVDTTAEEFTAFENAVAEEEVKDLLTFTRARVAIAEQMQPRIPTVQEAADAKWFMAVTDNPERRKRMFSRASMEKLDELKSPAAWVSWLRELFDQEEAEAQRLAEAELSRSFPNEGQADQPKWRIRIRVHTDSHSIRAKVLKAWPFHKFNHLVYVNGTELIVEFVMPKKVLIQSAWGVGFAQSRRFVAALNIGAGGLFWWDLPKHVSTYYEELVDLETESRVGIGISPILRIDWSGKSGENQGAPATDNARRIALTEVHLRNTAVVYSMLPTPSETDLHGPIDHYLTGLALMAKADIFLPMEPPALKEFSEALKFGMRVYGDWLEPEPFAEAYHRFFQAVYPDGEARQLVLTLIGIADSFPGKPEKPITLGDAAALKSQCDIYFNRVFNKRLAGRGSEDPR